MKPVRNSQIIQIQLTAGQHTYDLTYQDLLIGKRVTGIVVSPTGGTTPTGATIADPENAYLFLRNSKNEEFLEYPCRNLRYTGNTPILQALPLDLRNIEWKKSTLKFPTSQTLTTGHVIELTIHYEQPKR